MANNQVQINVETQVATDQLDDHAHGSHTNDVFLEDPSYLPIIGSFALFLFAIGAVNWIHGSFYGMLTFFAGLIILLGMIYTWFKSVVIASFRPEIRDNHTLEGCFRSGMIWFIFSEVCFFSVFFGSLFYIRVIVLPELGGTYEPTMTHILLWPGFSGDWPLLRTPDPSQYLGPEASIGAWGLPAINTLILLTSGVTITIAHWGVIARHKAQAIIGQFLTIALGVLFLYCQYLEYHEAYTEKGLRFDSGIFGNLFFMLTGFHGLHVTLGTIMLIVILVRMFKDHFTPEHHFAFEAVAWYWHFVDVVWLILFVFVYWL